MFCLKRRKNRLFSPITAALKIRVITLIFQPTIFDSMSLLERRPETLCIAASRCFCCSWIHWTSRAKFYASELSGSRCKSMSSSPEHTLML